MAVEERGGRVNMTAVRRLTSPERTKVWVEPKSRRAERKMVPVVYYLSKNGQLEHPHFMEVPLSSDGLFLKDVMNRLNFLRGKGLANMYAWSSKRSYKSGFVWHDLSDNDLIHPAQGQEYVLKGSELLHHLPPPPPPATSSCDSHSSSISSFPDQQLPAVVKPGEPSHRRNKSWSNLDLAEYKVYKSSPAADASTQTDDKSRRRRRSVGLVKNTDVNPDAVTDAVEIEETELSRDEVSPPPVSSSPETLEALIKADRRLVLPAVDGAGADICDRTARDGPSGRMRASTVLMQLISCGSISVKDHGLSFISHYKERVSRVTGFGAGAMSDSLSKVTDSVTDTPHFDRVRLEDKEYFSASLVDQASKVDELLPGLKRSSSYNADRSSMSDLIEEVGEEAHHTIKCLPRKLKSTARSKMNDVNSSISRSTHGSKRISEDEHLK